MKKRISLSVTAAALAASTLLSSTCSASAFSALASLALDRVAETTEETAVSYPEPMTNGTTSSRYKTFTSSRPTVSARGGYYGGTLTWSEVNDALLYYIYKKNGNSYKLYAKTVNTSYNVDGSGSFYVRAVTYNYNDKRIFSKRSSVVEISYYERDYDYYDSIAYEEAETNGLSYISNGGYAYTAAESAYDDEADEGWYDDPYLDNEDYTHYDVDGFKSTAQTPVSTFSADVDTASYANVRRIATDGYNIDPDAVRIEEFLNYFEYNYKQPKNSKFNVHYEYTDCPWNEDAKLLFMGIQAKDISYEPASNLVFLIDVSGSMYSRDKLPLVKDSLKKLSNETDKNDRISIVTYSGTEKVIVSGAKGNMKNCIADLTDCLEASGCTNGERGMEMAYEIAKKYYKKDGSNRVIMATDGDLNVGITEKEDLSTFVSKKRDTGIYLTVLGFGTGNLKDDKMETLAKDGNGNYHYIDCAAEATKVLVDERKKTLITVADDVKIQVEFNPSVVGSYKLIGYDGRKLNNEDFTNDKKDAADMGAGQSVTVMYEIIPAKKSDSSLQYQTSTGNKTEVCSLKIRYKESGATKSVQKGVKIKTSAYLPYEKTGIRFRFASCVAETAMALREEASYGDVSIANAKARFDKLTDKELSAIGYSDDFAQLLELLG